MNTFTDYSRPQSNIPYHKFEVKCTRDNRVFRFLAITGIAMAVIAGIALCYTTPGTATYFAATGDLAIGIFLLGGSILTHYKVNCRDLQRLPLPNAKTVEEYLSLLDLNEGNTYGFHIPDLLENLKQTQSEEALLKQTTCDFIRANTYLLNGKKLDSLNKVPKYIHPYLNQALMADLMGPLKGRYWNDELGIHLFQRGHQAPMTINVVTEGNKWYIYFSQDFQIEFTNSKIEGYELLYFKAELRVDPFYLNGPGYLTWHSPQKERQTFY